MVHTYMPPTPSSFFPPPSCLATVGKMAEPMPPEAVPATPEAELQPEASPEVKSKHPSRKKVSVPPEKDSQQDPDRNFDRQPVFLVMASGQIQSAEVVLMSTTLLLANPIIFVCLFWCADSRI